MSKVNLPPENKFVGAKVADYELVNEIGRGNIGVVYKAHNSENDIYRAVKIIPKENLKPAALSIEIKKVGKLVGIPQIAQYITHDAILLDNVPYVYILWEYIPGVDLRKFIKQKPSAITIEFVKEVIIQILQAFQAMKKEKIAHNDLHEGNILIYYDDRLVDPNTPRIKITDFGIGGSYTTLPPKDDYKELARICNNLLELFDPSNLDGLDLFLYDKFIEFIQKKLLETNPTVGTFVQNPIELINILKHLIDEHEAKTNKPKKLNYPFDYLRCEQIGNSLELLQLLYSQNFPGYNDLLRKNNTILTGPRGCGKTTIFRNLSLKTKLMVKESDVISDDFIGIYYHCNDLYFAFPYIESNLNSERRQAIIHYFNLSILYGILDLLSVASTKSKDLTSRNEITDLQEFLKRYFSTYYPPPEGSDIIRHIMSFAGEERRTVRNWFNRKKGVKKPDFLHLDFIRDISLFLQKNIKLFKDKPIYYLLDDYSMPLISKQLQQTLNDFIFLPTEGSEYFFKISTESIITFYPYNSKNKLLIENREYVIVDLGFYFLTGDFKVIERFILEVINNRLKNSDKIDTQYHDIRLILGKSPYESYNDLARQIREGKRALYYGWDTIVDLCSGDVANILELIKRMFETVGPENFSKSDGVRIPLDYLESDSLKTTHIQDKAIREAGNEFLQKIEAIPEEDYGPQLKKIVEAFGHMAYWYLLNQDSKNMKGRPPYQTFRIEMQEAPNLDAKSKCIYENLIKYGIFLRDMRGKSQRGNVVDRLYLRRLLIPTFRLTPSKRDSIRLNQEEFLLLLNEPGRCENISAIRKMAKKTKLLLDVKQKKIEKTEEDSQ